MEYVDYPHVGDADTPIKDRMLIIDMLHPELLHPKLFPLSEEEAGHKIDCRMTNLLSRKPEDITPTDIWCVKNEKQFLGVPREEYIKAQAMEALRKATEKGYKNIGFLTSCQTSAPTWHAVNDAADQGTDVAWVLSESVPLSSAQFLKSKAVTAGSGWQHGFLSVAQGFMGVFQQDSLSIEKQFTNGVAAPLSLMWSTADETITHDDRDRVFQALKKGSCIVTQQNAGNASHAHMGQHSTELSQELWSCVSRCTGLSKAQQAGSEGGWVAKIDGSEHRGMGASRFSSSE